MRAVFGIYRDQFASENAVAALRAAGFRKTDVSVLFPENSGTNAKASERAATGASSGAVIGGALGWLVGIGALAIPELGPFIVAGFHLSYWCVEIVAGPLMMALAGVGAGGVVGGIAGAMIGLGIPEYAAKLYERRVKSGAVLLSVNSDNSHWTQRAKEILVGTGAQDVASISQAKADYATRAKTVLRNRNAHASQA